MKWLIINFSYDENIFSNDKNEENISVKRLLIFHEHTNSIVDVINTEKKQKIMLTNGGSDAHLVVVVHFVM